TPGTLPAPSTRTPSMSRSDDKYWARRRKNNMAAKRSRDARRLKENQIAIRAAFLEKENSALRQEVSALRKELRRTKNVLAKYESQHGSLASQPLPQTPPAAGVFPQCTCLDTLP
uniref:BZIP domain-containing protein n=1 Tax=Kryptolebias marmoratus TaxID=37003 RepID=A0A3Q3ARM5_KRYMA